jgi:hypothetical protein
MNESLLDEPWQGAFRQARSDLDRAASSLTEHKAKPYAREAAVAIGFARDLLDMLATKANSGEPAPRLMTPNADGSSTLRGAHGITWTGIPSIPTPAAFIAPGE